MAWNDPGGKDPWGNNQGGGAPPDLDEALRKLKQKLERMFGGKGGGSGSSSGGGFGSAKVPILIGIVALLIFWAWQGVYIINEKERGVVLRFGEYHKTIGPGLSWQPWLLDTVFVEPVTSERQYSATGLMLTKDENIVQVPLTVQYNIESVEDFVLNIRSPNQTLEQATDSAIRHVVGSSTLNEVLSEGRQVLREEVHRRLQNYLDSYGSGVNVVDITLQRGAPPDAVREAFDDVNAAEADRDRMIDEAEAYRNGVLPEARGRAQRTIEEAQAYRGRVVEQAKGDASRFNQLYTQYELAPDVMRERLYLDAMQQVLSNSSKVMLGAEEGGSNLLYLPLDKMMSGSSSSSSGSSSSGSGGSRINNQQGTQEILDEVMNRLEQNRSGNNSRSLR